MAKAIKTTKTENVEFPSWFDHKIVGDDFISLSHIMRRVASGELNTETGKDGKQILGKNKLINYMIAKIPDRHKALTSLKKGDCEIHS